MKSARPTVVMPDRDSVTAEKLSPMDSRSLIHSNELLRQLSDLVDGLVNLSAPFKYSSAGSSEADDWAQQDYTGNLLAVNPGDTDSSRQILLSR